MRNKTRSTLPRGRGQSEREYILADTPHTYAQRLRGSSMEANMAHKTDWGEALFTIHREENEPLQILVKGRDRWALECLIAAGRKGCTPIDTPGPRWSAYVHNLRTLGVPIETLHESHGGPFAGSHARYVLKAAVTRSDGQEAA